MSWELKIKPDRVELYDFERKFVAEVSSDEVAAIQRGITRELGQRMKEEGCKINWTLAKKAKMRGDFDTFTPRTNYIPKHFGKELALLFWAVSGAESDQIPAILTNWSGLEPEERWWLCTNARASKNNWQAAIRLALTPVEAQP